MSDERPSPTQSEVDLNRLRMEGKPLPDPEPPLIKLSSSDREPKKEEGETRHIESEKPEGGYKTRHMKHDRS